MALLRRNQLYSYIIYAVVAIYIVLMLASLQYRFLDSFFVGTRYGNIGFDFFSIPRGFLSLVDGQSIFNSSYSNYGPYATWYPYHPFLAVGFGSWLSLFSPWTAYLIFVLLSLGILFYTAYQLSRLFENEILKACCYFSIFCSPPVYLMIWNAQAHVFLILSIALILIGIYQYYQGKDKEADKKIIAGLLISLLSKPIVLLMLPVLFLNKKTRKSTIIAIVVYAIISMAFLMAPFLNPQGDNQVHWTNIYYQSRIIESNHPELFSMPTFTDNLLDVKIFDPIYKIPLLLSLGLTALIVFIRGDKNKAIFLLMSVLLICYCYYISYNLIWEYQYTTLLPSVMIFILMINRIAEIKAKRTMFCMAVLTATLYLPTLYFLIKDSWSHHLVLLRVCRLLPVTGIFTLLFFLIIDYLIQLKKEGDLNFRKIDV